MENCWKPSKVSHQFLAGAISKEAKVVCFPHCEDQLLLIMKGSALEDQILYCEGKDGVNAYLWDRNFCWIVAGLRVGRVVRFIPKEICYYPPVEMLDPFWERAREVRDNPAPTIQEDAARRVEIRRELTRIIKSYIIEEDKRRDGGQQITSCNARTVKLLRRFPFSPTRRTGMENCIWLRKSLTATTRKSRNTKPSTNFTGARYGVLPLN